MRYVERGEQKSALVKVHLCENCTLKLEYQVVKNDRVEAEGEETAKKEEEETQTRAKNQASLIINSSLSMKTARLLPILLVHRRVEIGKHMRVLIQLVRLHLSDQMFPDFCVVVLLSILLFLF